LISPATRRSRIFFSARLRSKAEARVMEVSGSGALATRWWRAVRRIARPQVHLAKEMIARADLARDSGSYHDAAILYREALRLLPDRADIAVQAGHMFKEARDFAAAESFYRIAEQQRPLDADLQHQLGHFYKTVDRLEDAEVHYQRAAALADGWADPLAELKALRERQLVPRAASDAEALAPELVARSVALSQTPALDEVVLRNLGGRPVSVSGSKLPVLAGIEAIRGICFSDRPIQLASVYIDGALIHSERIAAVPTDDPALSKAVFNLWVDLSNTPPGARRLEVVLTDQAGMTRRHFQPVLIAVAPDDNEANRATDSIVFLSEDRELSLEARIRSAPSVRRGIRQHLPNTPETILVLRTDQLGDVVVSVPAIRRLRVHFPAAKLVGLLTQANVELAEALALFDEIIVIDFPDDPLLRQRTMSAEDQRALRDRLSAYRFDVAIDLATSNMSRPLLKLTGAKLNFGFDDDNCPWVDGGITGNVRDVRNRGEVSPQSGRIVGLVDRLATVFGTGAIVMANTNTAQSGLALLGLDEHDRYAVLHLGARVVFSRWAGYPELARRLMERHDLKIVVLGGDSDIHPVFADMIDMTDRLIVLDRRLPFKDLDLLLSRAAIFVGNDSGPKHLAALRGTPVVSIHCARISWAEWGQEQTGVVISRRVPCAGCAIFHDGEECAKNFACVNDIRVSEVLAAVEEQLGGQTTN
jgi:ADP-heptose:LPS heptosyltransferase/Arc/MetJ-type ribon-helix-helix transcriptional regulator